MLYTDILGENSLIIQDHWLGRVEIDTIDFNNTWKHANNRFISDDLLGMSVIVSKKSHRLPFQLHFIDLSININRCISRRKWFCSPCMVKRQKHEIKLRFKTDQTRRYSYTFSWPWIHRRVTILNYIIVSWCYFSFFCVSIREQCDRPEGKG